MPHRQGLSSMTFGSDNSADRPMPRSSGLQWSTLCAALAATVLLAACEETGPTVVSASESARVGGMEVSVTDHELRVPEVSNDGRIHTYDEPVMAVTVSLTNRGKDAFRYSPPHGANQLSEATTPLLYFAPEGEQSTVPPATKQTIAGVSLQKGHFQGQVTNPVTIAPGDSVEDVFLFEVPERSPAELIFSVPPAMHRGDLPVLIRMQFESSEPTGPEVYSSGEAVELDGVQFKVTGSEADYLKLEHSSQGEGYSSDPALVVNYSITNNTDEPVTYRPGHRDVAGRRVASVTSEQSTYARLKFSGSTTVEGQITEDTTIKPGESVEDFSIFERPGESVSELRFTFPASRFGRDSLVRYDLSYEYQELEVPEPLRDDGDDDE